MPKTSQSIIENAVLGISDILTYAAYNLFLYIGVYKYVTELAYRASTNNSNAKEASPADLEYLICMLLKAATNGDEQAIQQFYKDITRVCSITTDRLYCDRHSSMAHKQKVLTDFLAATDIPNTENALAIIAQLNQSVGNHAVNLIISTLLASGEFRHGFLQDQMQARLYQRGRQVGICYSIPMYELVEDSEEKKPSKEIRAQLELTILPNGTVEANHDIILLDITRVEPSFNLYHLFKRKDRQPITPCTVKIEQLPDEDWSTLDLVM